MASDEDQAMTRSETIFEELHRLMDEQMKALNKKLTREDAIEYATRAARIKELLALVNPDETGAPSESKETAPYLNGE
jgi:hypothetical protein